MRTRTTAEIADDLRSIGTRKTHKQESYRSRNPNDHFTHVHLHMLRGRSRTINVERNRAFLSQRNLEKPDILTGLERGRIKKFDAA